MNISLVYLKEQYKLLNKILNRGRFSDKDQCNMDGLNSLLTGIIDACEASGEVTLTVHEENTLHCVN
jgi:hypothetical protein